MMVRAEIAARLRERVPEDCFVVPGSLPVISFGDAFTADVATIALNPSWREFIDANQQWRDGEQRRLESLRSLGVSAAAQLDDVQLDTVMRRSNGYFQHHPYRTWFNPLNTVVREATGADFYSGTACHLDLVQWSTYKVQKDLGAAWSALVHRDKQFLAWQIETASARTFVMNGKTVVDSLVAEGLVSIPEEHRIDYTDVHGKLRYVTVFAARANGKTFIGWNLTLAYGVPKVIRADFIRTLQQALQV